MTFEMKITPKCPNLSNIRAFYGPQIDENTSRQPISEKYTLISQYGIISPLVGIVRFDLMVKNNDQLKLMKLSKSSKNKQCRYSAVFVFIFQSRIHARTAKIMQNIINIKYVHINQIQ